MLRVRFLWRCACGDDSHTQNGETSLFRAALDNNEDCVRLLLDAGADKDAKNLVRFPSLLFLLRLPIEFLLSRFIRCPLFVFFRIHCFLNSMCAARCQSVS